MQIEHKLTIYSNEAYLVIRQITVGKKHRSLFDASIHKIGILLKLAKMEQVYPLCKLIDIKMQMNILQTTLHEAINKIEQQLIDNNINLTKYQFITKDEFTVRFGNPLIYQLIKLLEQFDRLICLLTLAKNLGMTLSQRLYFTEKDKYQQMLFRFLSSIVQLSLKELPRISLEDVIKKKESYLVVIEKWGSINEDELFTELKQNFPWHLN